jgi:hypothetical protein
MADSRGQHPGGDPETTSPPHRSTSPIRFAVGVAAPGGIRGGGHLTISPNLLECHLGAVSKRMAGIASVRHRGTHVRVYKARLVPFWCNVSAIVDDGQTAVLASTWSFGLRRLVKALSAAGFQVEVCKTWTFRGLHTLEIISPRKRRDR